MAMLSERSYYHAYAKTALDWYKGKVCWICQRSCWTRGSLFTILIDKLIKYYYVQVQITYPIGYRGTEPLYLGSLVGGVHLIDNDGHFEYAKAIRLTYNVRDDKVANISYVWRKKLTEYLTKTVDNGIIIEIFLLFQVLF